MNDPRIAVTLLLAKAEADVAALRRVLDLLPAPAVAESPAPEGALFATPHGDSA